jgi:hypothetical protein
MNLTKPIDNKWIVRLIKLLQKEDKLLDSINFSIVDYLFEKQENLIAGEKERTNLLKFSNFLSVDFETGEPQRRRLPDLQGICFTNLLRPFGATKDFLWQAAG